MFVIHGHSDTLSTVVATSSAQKAVFHFKRMTQSGLQAVIKNAEGLTCSPRALSAGRSPTSQANRWLD